MRTTSVFYSVFLIAFAVQQAAATGWTDAGSFSCPSNTNNQCSSQQRSGFDWSSLGFGSFSSYGGFQFSGFECSSSFSKRDVLLPRGFQEKCIQGSVGINSANSPQISCGSSEAFSITEMDITVSFDTDLDIIYNMADGSVCKHTASCVAAGSTIQNTQCGGAKSVTFQLPDSSKQSECSIGIHSIGFDCDKAETTVPVQSTTIQSTTIQSTPAAPTTATFVSTPSISTAIAPLSTNTLPPTTAAPYGNLSTTAAAILPSNSVSEITSVVFVTTEITKIQCAASITNCPARSTIVLTSTISQYTTICPVTATEHSTTTPLPAPVSTTPSVTPPSTTPLSTPSTTPSASSSHTTEASLSTTTPQPAPSVSTNVAPVFASTTTTTPLPPQTTEEVVTTEVVFETTTVCPVTQTIPSGNTQIIQTTLSVSTFLVTSVKTVCTRCIAPQSTASPSTVELPPTITTTPSQSTTVAATALSPSAPPPGTTQEIVTTEIVYETTTFCPVTATITTGALAFTTTTQSVSTFFITSISTICTKCIAPRPTTAPSISTTPLPVPATTPSVSTAVAPVSTASAAVPPPSAPCPDVLPKCLNTWIFTTGCANNAHASCYCPQANFTTNVIACVQAYGATTAEVQSALSYLVGICAPYINQNPGIITGLPSSISVGPPSPAQTQTTPVSAPAGSVTTAVPPPPLTTQVAIPVTTIIISTTVTVPCTYQNSPVPVTTTVPPTGTETLIQTVVQTFPPSISVSVSVTTIITTVIVPQVQFTTVLPASTGGSPSVGLAAGAPATNTAGPVTPAASTASETVVAAIPTTLASVSGGSTPAATTTALATFAGAGSALSIPNGLVIGLLVAIGGLAVML